MAFIIIKDRPFRYGKTRSEQEKNLRKDGMATMTDAQLDKCKYLERKSGVKKSFFSRGEIEEAR